MERRLRLRIFFHDCNERRWRRDDDMWTNKLSLVFLRGKCVFRVRRRFEIMHGYYWLHLNQVHHTNVFSLCSGGVRVAVGGPFPHIFLFQYNQSGTAILLGRSTGPPALSVSLVSSIVSECAVCVSVPPRRCFPPPLIFVCKRLDANLFVSVFAKVLRKVSFVPFLSNRLYFFFLIFHSKYRVPSCFIDRGRWCSSARVQRH